jgi:PilZ domain-containing protein
MFSRLQAAIPILTDDIPVERWVKKIFPWKADRESATPAVLDKRECYRLDTKNHPPMDATLISHQSGSIIDIHVLDLSAGGLSGKVSVPENFYIDQVLTLVFVLPLEDLTLIKTEASLISVDAQDNGETILHVEFCESLDSGQRDLIHGYIVKKQFEMIKQLKGWGMS